MQPASGRSTAVLHPCSLTECCCRRTAETLILLAQLNQPVPVGVPSGWCRSALILRQKVAKATWWPGSASTGIFFPREATNSNALRACERRQFLVRDLRHQASPRSQITIVTLGSNHLTYQTLDIQESHPPTIQGTPQAPLSQDVEKGFNYINYSLKRCLDICIYTIYKYNI